MTGRMARIDAAAISANVETLRRIAGTAHFMAVVKAGGYGHGAGTAARAALDGGADLLGVADVDEALALRRAGIDAPVLAWLHGSTTDFSAAVAARVEIGVSSLAQLDAAARAGERTGVIPVAQLKVDTGLSRNGIAADALSRTLAAAAELDRQGALEVRGVFSHLANASERDDLAQLAGLRSAVAEARSAGLDPPLVHLAATAATIDRPTTRLDAVRCGIGIYGVSPFDDRSAADLGLVPAMRLTATVAAVRRIEAGAGVSYGFDYRATRPTTLALVPLGYADGIPRSASGHASVLVAGRRHPIAGRIAMDQFVVDVGDAAVAVGDEVVVFGDPDGDAPSAEEWADAAGTIGYEIVTRIGPRVPRTPA